MADNVGLLIRIARKDRELLKRLCHKEEVYISEIIRPVILKEIRRLAKKHGVKCEQVN